MVVWTDKMVLYSDMCYVSHCLNCRGLFVDVCEKTVKLASCLFTCLNRAFFKYFDFFDLLLPLFCYLPIETDEYGER